jgi:DNA-binding MarR family transcriptional regulator
MDKRSRRIVLTPAGRSKLQESLVLWENAQNHIEKIFGTQKAKTLRASLDILSSMAFSHAFKMLRQRDGDRTRIS